MQNSRWILTRFLSYPFVPVFDSYTRFSSAIKYGEIFAWVAPAEFLICTERGRCARTHTHTHGCRVQQVVEKNQLVFIWCRTTYYTVRNGVRIYTINEWNDYYKYKLSGAGKNNLVIFIGFFSTVLYIGFMKLFAVYRSLGSKSWFLVEATSIDCCLGKIERCANNRGQRMNEWIRDTHVYLANQKDVGRTFQSA